MYVASDLAGIARNNGFVSVAGVDQAVGTPVPTAALRSFMTLGPADGVYYAQSLGILVVTKAGANFDGIDFRGVSLNIQANDVTIRNSTFDASSGTYAINAMPGTANLTVDHSTFDGLKLNKPNYVDFVTSRGLNTVLTNNAFLDAPSDAVSIQSGVIKDNYFAGASYATGAHADAIWVGKTIGPVMISDNTIDWRSRADAPNGTNNPIRITGEGGDVAGVTVTRNIILGGSMTVLVSDGATMTHTADKVGSVTGVKIIDNVVDFGKFGSLEQTSRPADMIYSNNVHASGAPKTPGLEATGSLPNLAKLHLVDSAAASAVLTGTASADHVTGGTGTDWIDAGAGNDVIVGGNGRDYIRGGAGADIFVYRSLTASGTDLIADFQSGIDRIDLATLAGAPKDASAWQWLGAESFTGHAWQLRYQIGSVSTSVQIDVDGDLKSDFQIQLSGAVHPTLRDFILGASAAGVPAVPAPEPAQPAPEPSQPAQPTPTPEPTPPTPEPATPTPTAPTDHPLPTIVLKAAPTGGFVGGSAAAEQLLGSEKNDGLRGGGGDDMLQGNLGRDIVYGGHGDDTFKFMKLSDSLSISRGRDYIGDFVHGEDHIDLQALDANSITAGHQGFTWIGSDVFDGHAGQLRFSAYASGGGQVQADVNGDGKVDFAIDVVTKIPLDLSDFVL